MKIQILSDLHLEFERHPEGEALLEKSVKDRDILVLAGDIHTGEAGYEFVRQQCNISPVIYIPGNHEYYGEDYSLLNSAIAKWNIHGLHVSPTNVLDVDNGVSFFFQTLWTDFKDETGVMREAERDMNDYHRIKFVGRRLRPADTQDFHRCELDNLKSNLAESTASKKVVVSHHAPSFRSVHNDYRHDRLNPAYCTDLEGFMQEHSVDLWIHGHVHNSLDYKVGNTRVVCNPRGYVGYEVNPNFDPSYTVEV